MASVKLHVSHPCILKEGSSLVNQQDVTLMWRQLFQGSLITNETIAKAEALLESLKPENPLRHRLANELIQIQKSVADSNQGRKD
jgi:hypothetical protein